MKKVLLMTAVALLSASSAIAMEEEDITPVGYDYSKMNVGLVDIAKAFTGSNVPAPCTSLVEELYNDGLFVAVGGQFAGENTYFSDLKSGTSVVNLGGTAGKVLCVNGVNSTLSDKIKEIYEKDVYIPKCGGAMNWFNFDWFSDPNNTPVGGNATAPNIRVRIVMNLFQNTLTEEKTIVNKVYAVNNQGNVAPENDNTAEKSGVNSAEFAEFDEDGDPCEDADGNYIWDPTQWMVYEFDTYCDKDEIGTETAPFRIKMEMSNWDLADGAMLIKSIQFLKVTDNTEPILNTRSKTMVKYTIDPPATTGVDATTAANVAQYSVNGNEVTFKAAGSVYTTSGALVATATANETVVLPKGFYVAKIGTQGFKFIAK